MNTTVQMSEVTAAKSLLAQQHADKIQRDRQNLTDELETDELEYDEPRCHWSPGGKADDCGEGLICPPCS